MKKILVMLIVLIICFSLVACGESSNDNITNTNEETISNSPQPKEDADEKTNVAEIDKKLFLGSSNVRKLESVASPEMLSAIKDDDYCYYLFYLGKIVNVPIDSDFSFLKQYSKKANSSFEITTAEYTSEEISSSTEQTVSETVNTSYGHKAQITGKFGSKYNNITLTYAFNYSWSKNNTESITESFSNTSKYSKENKVTTRLEFNENSPEGFYGYGVTAVLKMYAFVVRDIKTDAYSVITYSEIDKKWMGFYYFAEQSDFINYEYETLKFEIPDNLPIPDETYESPDSWESISLTMEWYNCNDGDKYNKNIPEESATWRSRHDGFELGELVLYGCKQIGNNYKILNEKDFSIKWKVIQDVEDLPKVGGSSKTEIAFDDCKTIHGTDFNEKIDEGAYWVRVTYSDDTQQTFKRANIMENAMPGTFVELCNSSWLNSNKKIKRIDCIIVYELDSGGPGFLGIWWHDRTNWRLEYTYNFN